MKFFGKPVNRWGWVRVAGLIVLAAVILWTLRSVVLRVMGIWGGYLSFSLLDGVQLAVIPLLVTSLAGWLEEQDARSVAEQSSQHQAEQALAARRKETLQRVQHGLQAPAANLGALLQASLPDLDGKGRGELLHSLHQKGLLGGASAALDLRGADFSGLVLHHAHLAGCWLPGVNLAGARLDGVHLGQAHLPGAGLGRAFLRHADLRGADLSGCDLAAANLESANLEGADLRAAALQGAFLRHANLKGCTLGAPDTLDAAVCIETTSPAGQKITNEKGRQYLREKELATLVDKL